MMTRWCGFAYNPKLIAPYECDRYALQFSAPLGRMTDLPPKRSRLFSGDYILDIVEVVYEERWFYYMVHSRTSGEIVTLGHERSWEDAEKQAMWSLKQLTGAEIEFGSAGSATVA